MHRTKIPIAGFGLLALLALAAAWLFGGSATAPERAAAATPINSVTCSDVYVDFPPLQAKGAPPGPEDLAGIPILAAPAAKSLNRLEVDPLTSKISFTSVVYIGPNLDDDPIGLPDKPPSPVPCSDPTKTQPGAPDKTDAAKAGPEANRLNADLKLAMLGNTTRPTVHPNARLVGNELQYETCVFSQAEGQWIRTDVNTTLTNKDPAVPNEVNFGNGIFRVGTTSPRDGDTLKPGEPSKFPTDCQAKLPGALHPTLVYNIVTVSRERVATSDHDDPLPANVRRDPDGPFPKNKLNPQVRDGTTEGPGTGGFLPDDWDGDGCPDWDELSPLWLNGMDPFNPNDCDSNYDGVYNALATAIPASKGPENNPAAGAYFHCIARLDHTKTANPEDPLTANLQCYTDAPALGGGPYPNFLGRSDGLAGPPPPPPYGDGQMSNLTGFLVKPEANYKVANNATFAADHLSVWLTPFPGPPVSLSATVQLQAANLPNDCPRQLHKIVPVPDVLPNDPATQAYRFDFQFATTPGSAANKCVRPGESVDVRVTFRGVAAPTLSHIMWANATTAGPAAQCTNTLDDDADGTVNDGCPGGPAVVGKLSEAGSTVVTKKPAITPVVKPGNNLIIAGCFESVEGGTGPNIYISAVIDGRKLVGTVQIFLAQALSNCQAGTPFGAPIVAKVELAEQSDTFDHDRDGCPDRDELAKPRVCGRDPYNPLDNDKNYYTTTHSLTTAAAQNVCKNGQPHNPCAGPDATKGTADDLANGTVVAGAYFSCIADNQPGPAGPPSIVSRLYCYTDNLIQAVNPHLPAGGTGDGLGGGAPPPPFGEVHATHTQLTGTIGPGNVISVEGCFANLHDPIFQPNVYVRTTINAGVDGKGTADIWFARPNCNNPDPAAPTIDNALVHTSEQPKDFDTDQDYCTDKQELGSNFQQGGLRDPYSVWDFMSMYAGTPLTKDRVVDVSDIVAMVDRFGTSDTFAGTGKYDRNSDPKALPPPPGLGNRASYHPGYDRGDIIPNGLPAGTTPRRYGPPNGASDVGDIVAVVDQFGHTCA